MKTVGDLKFFVKGKEGYNALKTYERLKKKGVKVPIEIENDLLELLGFQGLGNGEMASSPGQVEETKSDEVAGEGSTSESESSGSESDSDSEDEKSEEEDLSHLSRWRSDNEAEKMFVSMKEKNGRTYDVFIQSLSKHGEHRRALATFRDMRKEGLQASVSTYNALLSYAYLLQRMPDKLWDLAQEILSQMNMEPAVSANLGTFNELLRMCSHLGPEAGPERALQLLREMHAVEIEPSLGSYEALLRATYYQRREGGPNWNPDRTVIHNVVCELEQMDKLPVIRDPYDVRFFNRAMAVVCVCRDVGLAKRLMALAERTDSYFLGEKRSHFYSEYLKTLAMTENNADYVYEVYKELVPAKFRPRVWVYTSLFKLAEKAKEPSLVPKLYADMKRYRIVVADKTCDAIFGALSKRTESKHVNDYIEVMEDVLHWMKKFDIPVNPLIAGQLVRMYSLAGSLDKAWKALEMFKDMNEVPTFTALRALLDGCKRNGSKEQAIQVFEMMASLGYHMSQRHRSDTFSGLHFTNEERQRCSALFEDMTQLDRRRSQMRNQRREHYSHRNPRKQAV